MKESIPCPHCHGKGSLPLSGVYAETLKGVRRWCKAYGYLVANQAASAFDCKPTALNNRLRRLEELGFVRSEWYGRQRRYTIT